MKRGLGRLLFNGSVLTAAVCLVAIGFLAVAVYVLIVDDPLGGEPVAIVSLHTLPSKSEPAQEPSPGGIGNSLAEQPDEEPPPEPGGQLVIRQADGSEYQSAPVMASIMVNPALVETSRHGLLPKLGPDGQRPADAYARPPRFDATGAARIAVVVTGMGLSTTASESAIDKLPGDVTLAFAPYGGEHDRLTRRARQDGHEIMLQVPLEPYDFPDNDPGPHTLLTGLSDSQNRDRLHWVMSRFSGYAGVTNHMGSRFSASHAHLRTFLAELRQRGLVYLEDGASPRSLSAEVAREVGLPFLSADVIIDAVATRKAIGAALAALEEVALDRGLAVGVASGLPASVDEIAAWAGTLESKGIVLVPVTSLFPGGQT